MAHTLIEALREAVRRWQLITPGDLVLLGVSGGADSVALLVAFDELRGELAVRIAAAHLDHGLRGAESDADRAFVAELAAARGVALHVERATLPAANLAAEARRARYAFFERVAAELGAARIATAHTRDDQAETVLLRLLAGSGRRGLGGIRPRRGRIIRPLLLCDRMQVRSFLVERGLDWRRDRSNFDWRHARARVRGGYLPALAREFNPRLAEALARLADVLREEDVLLDRLAAHAIGSGPEPVLAVLQALEPPLLRRAVRRWWRRYGSGRRLGFGHVEAIARLVARAGGAGEVRVPGGAVARTPRTLAFRGGRTPPAPAPYAHTLAPGATLALADGWRLRLTALPTATRPPADAWRCVVDAERVPATLTVRSRRPGDRLRPLGLGGRTTVKRLLIARRVPRALRAGYPLVLSGDEIVWVPGCARAEHALVTPATRRCLVLEVEAHPGALDGT